VEVAIVTVGEELLAGETENTNASWLGRQLADRGVRIARVLTIPDDRAVIADAVARYRGDFDAVLVGGGLGGTHDDVTMDAVAEAVGRPLVVDESVRERVVETAAAYREANPETVDRYDLSFDPDAWAERPEGARVIPNDAGLAPGAVVEADEAAGAVYVLPGPPDELRAVFERIAGEFGGELTATSLHTPMPESALLSHVDGARERFDVAVGSYPSVGEAHNRVKVSGEDPGAIDAAVDWLRDRLDVIEDPDP
jgi:molybdenum cofactor synthesis domain-containing protein